MCFSVNFKKWVAGLMVACLALPLVGCSPEASTTTTKPRWWMRQTGQMSRCRRRRQARPTKEQAGSTLGGSSAEKGREAPEPNAADPAGAPADEKPAAEKPATEKPKITSLSFTAN